MYNIRNELNKVAKDLEEIKHMMALRGYTPTEVDPWIIPIEKFKVTTNQH